MTDSKTVVEDLAAWLTAVWDEEERHENSKYTMRSDTPTPLEWSHRFSDLMDVRIGDSPFEERMPESEFRERFMTPSPDKQVLARIAADRKMLALHSGDKDEPCQSYAGNWIYEPCETLLLLASPYADRPGFNPEWLVERQGVEQ